MVCRHHRRVTLSGWWWWAGRCWNLPANHAGARPQLQTVQVIQVSEGRGQRTGSRSVSGPIVFLLWLPTFPTWGCCFWDLRYRWQVHQKGSTGFQSERSCVQDGGRGVGHSLALWPSDVSTPSDSPEGIRCYIVKLS